MSSVPSPARCEWHTVVGAAKKRQVTVSGTAKKSCLGSFRIWNILFVGARVGDTVLAILVFWHGLKASEVPAVDFAAGNYNTSFVR